MKVDDSILENIRETVTGDKDNTAFDSELIPFINSSLFNLNQNGIGNSIIVHGAKETWGDFVNGTHTFENNSFKSIPLYVYLNTKLLFDPPPPSNVQYHDKVVNEMLWRLKIEFEVEEEVKYDPDGRFNNPPWNDSPRT